MSRRDNHYSMYLRCPYWLLVMLLVLPAGFAAEETGYRPKAFKLPGTPLETSSYLGMMPSKTGWLATFDGGFLRQSGMEWQVIRVPEITEALLTMPYQHGILTAGMGVVTLHEDGKWSVTHTDDYIKSALAYEDSALLAGQDGAYWVGAEGTPRQVLQYPQKVLAADLHYENSHVILSTFHPGFVYEWTQGRFIPAGKEFSFRRPNARQYWIRQEGGESGYYFDGEQTTPAEILPPGELSVLRALWPDLAAKRILGRVICSRDKIIAATEEGLWAYSVRTGQPLWHLGLEEFEGNPRNINLSTEGLLVGGANGLYVVPDPDYVTFAPNPKGGILNIYQSANGLLVLTQVGAFRSGGQPLNFDGPSPRVMAVMEDGTLAWVDIEMVIHWGGSRIQLPQSPVFSGGIMGLPRERLLVSNHSDVRIFEKNGQSIPWHVPGRLTSVALIRKTGGFLAASNKGAFLVSDDGMVNKTLAQEPAYCFEWQDTALFLDQQGRWYDQEGRKLGTLPLSGFPNTTVWNGNLCLTGILPDGKHWVGVADPKDGTWRTLDLPFSGSQIGLGVDDGKLIVVLPGESMAVSEPRYLPSPRADAAIRLPDRGWTPETVLRSEENTVELRLPPPRLSPWRNPDYQLKVSDGEWQKLTPGATIQIPRLSWGRTDVVVKASWANLESTSTYAIRRAWPWWLRWPGWLLYGSVLGLSVAGLVRWRTRRFERRARELEQVVEERTVALTVKTQQLDAANATKSEFIASMNHEIRNPMNGILGLTRMLEEGKLEPRERELLRTLEACTEQLRSTMDDVLDFRSLEQGEIKQAEEDFELGALLRGACAAADLTGTRIVLTNPPTDPVFLHGDQGKLRQIVGNYLSNALKYGVPPHAEVKVEVSDETAGRRTVALQVCNHGPTLGEEELGKLFTVFYRGSRAAASGAAGTGLGLAVCRRLAEAMGGSTGATSAKALTTFHLTIPFAVAQGKSSEPMAQLPGILGGRVLVAEDEDYNRMVLGYYLQQLGFEPDWAGKGSDALALAARHDYRLLISDWMLPDMNGGELIRRMRAQLAEKMPPVLVVSAYATSEKREEVLASGAAAFLTKPVDERKLRAVLAEINLGPGPAAAPAEPVGDAADDPYDFSGLLVLGEKATVLGRYIGQVETGWAEVEARQRDWPAAAELVHKLRSQALLIRAVSAAEQLRLLEEALLGQWSEDEVAALRDCAGREIRALLQAARRL